MTDRRSYINNNLSNLLRLINLEKLLPELKRKFGPALNPIDLMANNIITDDLKLQNAQKGYACVSMFKYERNLNEPIKKKEYILQHMPDMKNTTDFVDFIHILLHTGHDSLALELYPNCIDMIDLNRCDPKNGYISTFSFGYHNSPEKLVESDQEMSSTDNYTMENSPRGFCVLVNNFFTVGTYIEMQRFRNIFYQLHFDVIMKKNIDAKDILKLLMNLSKSKKLENHNAFVFMIIAHGNENKEILGFDGEHVNIDLLIEMFDNEHCPQMQNNPRLFFFNCCRGINDVPVKSRLSTQQTVHRKHQNIFDYFICNSTFDDYVANIVWKEGTLFGKILADTLVQKAWYMDLYSILIKANNLLQNKLKELPKKQLGTYHPLEWTSFLRKQIQFYPLKPTYLPICCTPNKGTPKIHDNWHILLKNDLDIFMLIINITNLVEAIKIFAKNLSIEYIDKIKKLDKKKEYLYKKLIYECDLSTEIAVEMFLFSGHDALAFKLDTKCIDLIDLNRGDPKLAVLSKEDILVQSDVSFTSSQTTSIGLCLLINNCLTYNTFNEMQRFRNIFHQLGFHVIMIKNLNKKELLKYLTILSKSTELEKYNKFVLLLLSRCNYKFELNGLDEKPFRYEFITKIFDDKNCPQLKNKPKLFFINCCSDDYYNSIPKRGIPVQNLKNTLICFSVFKGDAKYFGDTGGSLFGKIFSKLLVTKSLSYDISDIMKTLRTIIDKLDDADKCLIKMKFKFDLNKGVYFSESCNSANKPFDLPDYVDFHNIVQPFQNVVKSENKTPMLYEKLFQELGSVDEGRFATVFKARSYKDGKLYAIKKIPIAEFEREKTIKEIAYIKTLNSNYVVEYIDHWIEDNYYIGTTDDRLKLTNLFFNEEKKLLLHIQLELCSMPLNFVIKILMNPYNTAKNTMNSAHFGFACEIFIQLLECVNYLHTLKPKALIHMDLKPENIMLVKGDNNRFVKLIDFGLSTYHYFVDHSHSSYTGTRQYRAPEIFSGRYDTKADIYSLGIIVQELFNIEINSGVITVDEGIVDENYKNLMKVCVQCLETLASKRPTCEDILKGKHLWAYSSPNKNSLNWIKEMATEKYQILFETEFDDFKKVISNPFKLDVYSKALINCVDRKQMVETNFEKWHKLIIIKRLLPAVWYKFPDKYESLKDYIDNISDEDKMKEFLLKWILDVSDENEFQILIQLLLYTGHDELAFKMYPPCIDMVDLRRCDPKNGFIPQFSFGFFNQLDSLKTKQYENVSSADCYKMYNTPRGFCFLLVNYFTVGTYREIQRFRNIFYQLHFEVIIKKNLVASDFRDRLLRLSNSDELKYHNAFVFLSITHGNENNEIYGFDGQAIQINEIIEMFNNENCPNLHKKPKMFFFNCCRGSNFDPGVPIVEYLATTTPPQQIRPSLPTKTDFLICYSTLDGYYATVDWYKGTNFGRTLADMLVENAWSDDILHILTKTNGLLVEAAETFHVQQPFDYTSDLTKLVKFFPFELKERKLIEKKPSFYTN